MSSKPTEYYNFSPGPAHLPDEVMALMAEHLRAWPNHFSVACQSHRSRAIETMFSECEERVRSLLSLSDHHAVLFMHGGATAQFAMIPQHLAHSEQVCAYLQLGRWGDLAAFEAKKYTKQVLSLYQDLDDIPAKAEDFDWPAGIHYAHLTSNETVDGWQLPDLNFHSALPLAIDMSSDIMTRPFDANLFRVIYASAQKNLGIAGLALVVVDSNYLDPAQNQIPSIFNWREQYQRKSMVNTPPVFAVAVMNQILAWILAQGGIAEMHSRAAQRSKLVYDAIDGEFYHCRVPKLLRSTINAVFYLPDAPLTDLFLQKAEQNGLFALKGHAAVGGIRASMYNAMPIRGVQMLVDFMSDFRKHHG